MGEQTPLSKNSPKFASLRLTLPISIVKQWGLKVGDRLDWSWKVLDGKIVLVVDKTDNTSPYNNNADRRTTSSSEQQDQQYKQPKQRQQYNNKSGKV